jgi:hypothetical protein
MDSQMEITVEDIPEAARSLDLSGQAVRIHASLRSFGWARVAAPPL